MEISDRPLPPARWTVTSDPIVFNIRKLSFGGPAAIVTSMALIVGLRMAAVEKKAIIGSLLIIGIADNLTDSLSVHIYQESERLEERKAFRTTVANYFVRLCVAMSFVAIVLLFSNRLATYLCIFWGFALLGTLSYLLARVREVDAFSEIWKHCGVAVVVIAMAMAIGNLLRFATGAP